MTKLESLKLFEDKKVRTVWDSEQEKWYFSVVDVVEVLTDSANPTDYLKKMRKRDEELGAYIGTNCPQIAMTTASGKKRKTLAADTDKHYAFESLRGFAKTDLTDEELLDGYFKNKYGI